MIVMPLLAVLMVLIGINEYRKVKTLAYLGFGVALAIFLTSLSKLVS
jgi:hypothetical protein